MAKKFDVVSFLLRVLLSVLLVFGTYNPTEYSYISWAFGGGAEFGPVTALVGILLLIAWIVFLRATFLALGWLGVTLGAAFFACVIWLLIDLGWLSLESTGTITWLSLLVIALILGVGLSWAHIRRALTGQYSVDDVED